LTVISTALLIFVFASKRSYIALHYIVFVFSAYTFTAFVVGFPQTVKESNLSLRRSKSLKRIKSFLYGKKYGRLYMTDTTFRIKLSLYTSFVLNVMYSVFKLSTGIYYFSFWYGSDALYYILLSAVRLLLLRHVHKEKQDLANEFRQYRLCAFFLLGLNITLAAVVYQIVDQGMGYQYPGLLIYIVATYAFVCITVAIVNVIKCYKLNSPILSAAKTINLVKALVAMFALQTAMFASFGDENRGYEHRMNRIFGGIVCVSIFSIAVFMIVRANQILKKNSSILKQLDD
jgi:hypothetical protein